MFHLKTDYYKVICTFFNTMTGVYAFVNQCIRDPFPPFNPMIKIGRGNILERFKNAQKNEGTYLPFPYEMICAKECEDDKEYEKYLHNKFAGNRYRPPNGSGLGTEWFRNITISEVQQEFENIPGKWFNLPEISQNTDIIRTKCHQDSIQDSEEYKQKYGNELPCEVYEMYDWLHPNTNKISKEEFNELVFIKNKIYKTDEYEAFAIKNRLPSLVQIQDGYFGRTGFIEMRDTYLPRRDRR